MTFEMTTQALVELIWEVVKGFLSTGTKRIETL